MNVLYVVFTRVNIMEKIRAGLLGSVTSLESQCHKKVTKQQMSASPFESQSLKSVLVRNL